MEQKEQSQKPNEQKDCQCGCSESSSLMGRMMAKMMKKMCGSKGQERFNSDSKMSEMNCCTNSQ